MTESLETIQREFDESQERSWARRDQTRKRKSLLWVFLAGVIIVGWVAFGLLVSGAI